MNIQKQNTYQQDFSELVKIANSIWQNWSDFEKCFKKLVPSDVNISLNSCILFYIKKLSEQNPSTMETLNNLMKELDNHISGFSE